MLTKKDKEKIVAEIAEVLQRDKTALFVDYSGVKTAALRKLRLQLREAGGALRVARKTLFLRALDAAGIARPPGETLEGQFAFAYGFRDAAEAAKALREFKKGLEAETGREAAFSLRGGILENRPLLAQDADTLARLPSRQELLAKLAGSFAAPLVGLVRVFSGPSRGLVYVLSAKSKVEIRHES